MTRLTMLAFLEAVRDHQMTAREALIAEGHHPNVVYAKALKAARKGYTNYGTIADRPWLEPPGWEYIAHPPKETQ